METKINARHLLATLPDVVRRVRKGGRFTVIYWGRPAFRIVPMDNVVATRTDWIGDALYWARPVGRCRVAPTSIDHDVAVYGL